MWHNKYKRNIMLFVLNFIAYSILLIYKYAKSDDSIKLSTVLEGYFLVNLFFLIMILPVSGVHKLLRKSELFLNNEIFSKVLQIILLIGSYIVLIKIPNLIMPLDVMSSMILWLYLYFCVIFITE
jgi:hypothetical protein